MYIVYDSDTLQGIKQYKDRRHGDQFANKLNIGSGREKYKCTVDQKFYQLYQDRWNAKEYAKWNTQVIKQFGTLPLWVWHS